MIVSASELYRFYRCGHLYQLIDIDGVPNPPTTRQLISRIVRDGVKADLTAWQEASAAARSLKNDTERHFAQTVAYTRAEAAQGRVRTMEANYTIALRMYMMWRSTVYQKIASISLQREYSMEIDGDVVTGFIEIEEAGSVRSTRVTTRTPEDGIADLRMLIPAVALGKEAAIVDCLIDQQRMAYMRQVHEITPEVIEATRERVKAALQAIERGQLVPADSSAWWCRSCQQRPVCRYV